LLPRSSWCRLRPTWTEIETELDRELRLRWTETETDVDRGWTDVAAEVELVQAETELDRD